MTKISYIHGIPQNESKDRAKGVPKKSFIDYTKMTDGQLRLNLIGEQLGILHGFYPDIKEWGEAHNQLNDYLQSGVNGREISQRNLLPFIKKEINRAKWMNVSASGVNGLIPTVDCEQFVVMEEDVYNNVTRVETAAYLKCEKDNKYKKLLNEHLEESAHHLLYKFLPSFSNEPAIVVTKGHGHRLAIEQLAKITGLGKENITLWIRNGVMRSNSVQGAQPFQPESTIDILKGKPNINFSTQQAQGESSVGIVWTAALVIQVIGAIVAAIKAANLLVMSMKPTDRQKMQNATAHYGLAGFGPEKNDYEGWGNSGGTSSGNNGGTGGGNGNDILGDLFSEKNMPFVIGGAALLLLK